MTEEFAQDFWQAYQRTALRAKIQDAWEAFKDDAEPAKASRVNKLISDLGGKPNLTLVNTNRRQPAQ